MGFVGSKIGFAGSKIGFVGSKIGLSTCWTVPSKTVSDTSCVSGSPPIAEDGVMMTDRLKPSVTFSWTVTIVTGTGGSLGRNNVTALVLFPGTSRERDVFVESVSENDPWSVDTLYCRAAVVVFPTKIPYARRPEAVLDSSSTPATTLSTSAAVYTFWFLLAVGTPFTTHCDPAACQFSIWLPVASVVSHAFVGSGG